MSYYRPYPAYKASEVEWFGMVPEHWRRLRLNRVVRVEEGLVDPRLPRHRESVLLAPNHIESGTGRILAMETAAAQSAESGKYVCTAGAVIYSKIRPALAKAAIAPCDCLCSADMYPLACDKSVKSEWLFYLLLSRPFTAWATLESDRVAMPKVNRDSLARLDIFLPLLAEQLSIVNKLSSETARIDALIEKKTRFIELLKEKRQALITHAVTKGLDPTVPMKDSGVEWIGEVPAHWNRTKLRFIVKERGGKTPSKDNARYWHGDVPWVSPKDMKVDVLKSSSDKITDYAVKQYGMTLFEVGTILVVVRGMILAHSFPVAETSAPVTINQDMKALTPCGDVEVTFLRLMLQSAKRVVVDILVAEAAHGTRVLRADIWKQLPLFLPSKMEQKAIIQRVERDSRKIDALAEATRRSIQLLKERRSALITAAVTGQIDLREDAA